MNKRRLLFCIGLGLLCNCAFSQNLKQITNSDGLDNSYVTSICQDVGGVLWIGTTDGVRLLWNQEVKPVDLGYGPILEDIIVHEIAETDDGLMWIATDKGLIKLDLHTGEQVMYDQFTGDYRIQGSVSRYEIAVLDSSQDLFFFNKKRNYFTRISIPLQAESQISNFGFNKDYLWTSGVNGLIRYKYEIDDNGVHGIDDFDIVMEGNILFCNKSKDDLFFVNNQHKLFLADLGSATTEELIDLEGDIMARGIPTGIARIENGFFISFRDCGVVKYLHSPNGWERYDLGIKAGVYRMKRDHNQDLVWIATEGEGLYKYWESDYSFYNYEVSDYSSIKSKNVNALYLDVDNHLWIGTRGSGLLKLHRHNNKGPSVYDEAIVLDTSNSGLCNDVIRCFSAISGNRLLIGTKGGLCMMDPRKNIIREVDGAEGITEINQIITAQDTIWISTDVGVFQGQINTNNGFSIRFIKRYTIGNGDKVFNQFKALAYESKKNQLWVGSRGRGLFCIHSDAILHMSPGLEELDNVSRNVLSLLYDSGRLWVGTGTGVIVYDDTGKPSVISRNHSLENNVIHTLIPDGDGGVWASTNNGIKNIDKSLSTIRNYGSQVGLKVTEFSDGAVLVSEDRVFYGGVGGWVEMVSNGNAFSEKTFSPTIHFGELIENDRHTLIYLRAESDHGEITRIKKPYKDNSFGFNFLVTDYIYQADIHYQYSLTKRGAKDNWIDNGYSSGVSFSNLPPGKYTLKARFSYPFLDVESNVICTDIQILPPWYLSTYAYALYAILAIMGIGTATIMAKRKEEETIAKQKNEFELQKQKELYNEKLQFFTNITHEFCTPLTLIFGPCEMLDKYNKSDSYIRKYTGIIRENTLRLNTLIRDIIEFSKFETNKYKVNITDVNVSGVIMSIFDSFRDMAQKSGIDYRADMPDDLSWKSDERCLYSIVSNLLSNALKYTPANGTIAVSAAIANDNLAIKIRNSGEGIKPEDIEHLFDRYRVLGSVEDQEKKGLMVQNGLGLAICQSMVKMLDGAISVDSVPGDYTEFDVTLPALTGKKTVSLASHSPSLTIVPPPNAAKLLVVDDDTDILLLMKDALSAYQVTTCDNAADGIRQIKEERPDLIITDVMMAGKNGLDFIRECKEDELIRNIPVIMISAKKAANDKIDGYEAGCDVYIEKPFEIEYLLSVVNRLLTKKDQDIKYYHSPASLFVYGNGKKMNREDKLFIDKLNDYISNRIQSQITVPELASFFNLSTRNLYRRFSDLELPPPNEYIKAYKIAYAGKLLRTTSLSIKEIMYDSGFNSKGNFYAEFKKMFKMSPTQYRLQPEESDNNPLIDTNNNED